MRVAFYRHYRPRKLAEVVGQEHITTTLKNALKSGQFSHAYLFTGPKGVGKTSVARILAHEINQIPYEDDQIHLDIIEIDAASNRRIDEIRELRDKIHIAPASAKYKVYIIDEVHMLTREAFNALLKTLEEPPAHVVFILATTEAHKVPETILSRTQRFTFRAVPDKDIVNYLSMIADKEKIKIDDEALQLIAAHGGGSFRDCIGLLDQLSGQKDTVTAETVRKVIGLPSDINTEKLINAISSGDVSIILEETQNLRASGINPSLTSKALIDRLRSELLSSKPRLAKMDILSLIDNLLNVSAYSDPAGALEIALLRHAIQDRPESTQSFTAVSVDAIETPDSKKPPKINKTSEKQVENSGGWSAVLAEAKKTHNTLYSVLRMAQTKQDGDRLVLGFKFPFHVKQISQEKNMNKIRELVATNFGGPLIVSVAVTEDYEEPLHADSKSQNEPDPTLANISNIFGSAELLD